MKQLILISLVLLASIGAHASTKQVIACNLNKTYSLVATFIENGGMVDRVELVTRDFMGRDEQFIVRLEKPKMQLIDYGNVLMTSEDFGRSGYAFLRLERRGSGQYDGYVDIALFNKPAIRSEGHMLQVPCYEQQE